MRELDTLATLSQGAVRIYRTESRRSQESECVFRAGNCAGPVVRAGICGVVEGLRNAGSLWLFAAGRGLSQSHRGGKQGGPLDERSADAHTALAHSTLYYEWNWTRSEQELHRALALDPNNAEAHQVYCLFLMTLRPFDEGIAEQKRAEGIDRTIQTVKLRGHLDCGRL